MAKRPLKPKEIVLVLLVMAAVAAWSKWGPKTETEPSAPPSGGTVQTPSSGSGEAAVLEAFRARRSDVQVEVEGKVVFLFPPDRDGKPHQRFLLELPGGHTLKVAHNLKFSGPIPLRKGDTVRLYGEYEYNAKGGVVHWTHRDPANRHPHGWIRHEGEVYR